MNLKDILNVNIMSDWVLHVSIGPIVWIALIVFIGICIFKQCLLLNQWEVIEIEVPFGGGKVKIVPNYEVVKIAHQAWTEIITRKAGLKFDEDNDLIIEVYNSWYELFKEIRFLIKNIPPQRLRDSKDAQRLIEVLIQVLNFGLRPHLTRWQGRFRRWFSSAIQVNKDASLQDIQKNYPDYQILIDDLRRVNNEMMILSEQLRRLLHH